MPRVPYSCASGLEAEPHSYKRTNRESRAPKDPYDHRRIRGNANQIFPKQRTTQKEAQKIHASWTLQLTWRWRLRRTAHTARNWRTLCARRAFTRALLVAAQELQQKRRAEELRAAEDTAAELLGGRYNV